MTGFTQATGLTGLFLGRTVAHSCREIQQGPANYNRSSNWDFRPGTYTPREFVREIAVLLESVIVQLGPDPPGTPSTRSILMDGLRSSLSHEGREATLPLADWKSETPSEMTHQALRVGKALYNYATEFNHKVPGNLHLTVYSPCEGHKWVPPAGRLLRSHRSSPILMMLYNEWLHQMTCLRDGLLPFSNFEEVRLSLKDTSARGTRPLEEIRNEFHVLVRSGRVNRADLLEIAKVFTAPSLAHGGYGFQYEKGCVLPELLFSESRTQLLRYLPAALVDAGTEPVLFDFGPEASFSIRQVDIASVEAASKTQSELTDVAIQAAKTRHDSLGARKSEQLNLVGTLNNGKSFTVEIGRIVQGLLSAHYIEPGDLELATSKQDSHSYDATELLSVEGTLVAAQPRISYTRAGDSMVRLALVGKLRPGDVFLGAGGVGKPEGAASSNRKPGFVILRK